MQQKRTRFAAIPPQPEFGQVRAFPRIVGGTEQAGDDETVIVRCRGRNFVFRNLEELRQEAIASAPPREAPSPLSLSSVLVAIALACLFFMAARVIG